MRYSIHIVWLLPLLGVAALGADDLPQPRKDPGAPATFPELPAPGAGGRAAPDADAAELQRHLRQLRTQREALHNERASSDRETAAMAPTTGNEAEISRLRKRMKELAAHGPTSRMDGGAPLLRPLQSSGLTPPREGDTSGNGVIDPVAVAQNYFRAGDYEPALEAYRRVPTRGSLAEERAPVQYMIATCLRKLGKRDEAAKVYREVVSIKDDPFLADCARWQLETLTWRKEVDTQLASLRQRRKGLQIKP
jgi:tetratricopeptide (TPR) repeat protein